MLSNLIRLGNKCNEKCLFCTVAYDNEKELSHEEVKEKINFIKKNGGTSITFTGGEPTIRNDLPELIKYAKSLGFYTELQTNGIRLANKELANKIIKSGVNAILFSFHSHKREVFDKLTGLEGSFEKTIEGIKNIGDRTEIHISHVINSLNYRDLV
ncbi:MAG: radical SAM protein, partial [Candidatus Aenigmarchaeota archaeon]|nr:radical SAM protein [Candidatus Aenigmarchaeota archaeon]